MARLNPVGCRLNLSLHVNLELTLTKLKTVQTSRIVPGIKLPSHCHKMVPGKTRGRRRFVVVPLLAHHPELGYTYRRSTGRSIPKGHLTRLGHAYQSSDGTTSSKRASCRTGNICDIVRVGQPCLAQEKDGHGWGFSKG